MRSPSTDTTNGAATSATCADPIAVCRFPAALPPPPEGVYNKDFSEARVGRMAADRSRPRRGPALNSQASGAAFRQPQLRSRRVSSPESGPSARAPSALVAQESVSVSFSGLRALWPPPRLWALRDGRPARGAPRHARPQSASGGGVQMQPRPSPAPRNTEKGHGQAAHQRRISPPAGIRRGREALH
ncbi:hypothetical protein PtB15_6B776 [Puccinia triticina]|nr:hypothetical protein PtB15_6B776 [Puccinia triticina]